MKKDLTSIFDLTQKDIKDILKLTYKLKKDPWKKQELLKNKSVGLVFQKPSNRTRMSFETAAVHLGGKGIYMDPADMTLGKREPVKDVARVFSGYVAMAILRTFSHETIEEFAKYATIPVINGLSDKCHPCQALADIFTIEEKLKDLMGKTLCYVGDGNNVLNSLLLAGANTGMNIVCACPKGHEPDQDILERAKTIALNTGAIISITNDPKKGVKNADVVYTDVWVSMGQEDQKSSKIKDFQGFQVNAELISECKKKPLIMHCLPAHRDEEITDDVIESKNSIVFDQAENRMHVQKAVMVMLLENKA
ncbi:MAG: ornithine carbamoyltransferase [Candidatus Omnitrophica bacterium]|nr:ornithine carbamoyltransferase [Candidatus Omnitrophota bacterium]